MHKSSKITSRNERGLVSARAPIPQTRSPGTAGIVDRCRPLLIRHFDCAGAQKECAVAQTPSLRAQRSNPGAGAPCPGLLRRPCGPPRNDGVTVIVNRCRPLLNPRCAAGGSGTSRTGSCKSLLISRGKARPGAAARPAGRLHAAIVNPCKSLLIPQASAAAVVPARPSSRSLVLRGTAWRCSRSSAASCKSLLIPRAPSRDPARASRAAIANSCRSLLMQPTRAGPRSMDRPHHVVPADGPGPFPNFPGAAAHRKEDELGRADQVFERHEPHVGEAAVLGVVAVVAHHEIMPGRDRVDARGVGKATTLRALQGVVGDPVRQRL